MAHHSSCRFVHIKSLPSMPDGSRVHLLVRVVWVSKEFIVNTRGGKMFTKRKRARSRTASSKRQLLNR